MNRIGIPGSMVVPSGILNGPNGSVPITSMSCSYTVGTIPVCRVGIPLEFLSSIPNQATTQLYQVQVGQGDQMFAIFTGYIAGRSGRISSNMVEAGITLVHPARDLDTMRIVSPGMHSQGAVDWSYVRASEEDDESNVEMYKLEGGLLPKQLIQGISDTMNYWNTTQDRFVWQGSGVPTYSQVSYTAAQALLAQIQVLNGNIGTVEKVLAETINDYAKRSLSGSYNTQSSLWNTVVSMMSDFGLTIICNNFGQVVVTSDLTNFQPPDDNYIYPDEIYAFDLSSSFGRNVGQVFLINTSARPVNNPDGNSDPIITVAAWPQTPSSDPSSGTLSMTMPGWLNALNPSIQEDGAAGDSDVGPPSPSNAQGKNNPAANLDTSLSSARLNLAHKFYNLESDKWRTMSISGPLAPGALPGTTVWVQPYSSVKSLTGKNLGGGEIYSGYIIEVQHTMSAQDRVLQTTLILSNVSETSEALNVTSDPIFDDVQPFVLN